MHSKQSEIYDFAQYFFYIVAKLIDFTAIYG